MLARFDGVFAHAPRAARADLVWEDDDAFLVQAYDGIRSDDEDGDAMPERAIGAAERDVPVYAVDGRTITSCLAAWTHR